METALKLPTNDASSESLKERAAALLDRTRARTLALVEQLSDRALNTVHDRLMSPIVWDLGHIANFEELWLVRRVGGGRALHDELGSVYDPFTAPRRERDKLPYLRSEDCFAYMAAVRERALDCLEHADLSESAGRLLAGGFVYELIARHEQQHSETILQTLQIMTSEPYKPPKAVDPPANRDPCQGLAFVSGGSFEMGASDTAFAYDNERPLRSRSIDPFWIDVRPVSNGEMAAFIADGGYERRELWSPDGWRWREREQITLPSYWERDEGGLCARSFDRVERLDPSKPVCHVSWYEADAYARWAGKRLPSEAEWERAASWNAAAGEKHIYPWGDDRPTAERANLDQLAFGTADAGAYPGGASPCGARQLLGDVWEWTSSSFDGYPGFRAFPYRDYSEPFFGGPFKVLRGGAWATQPDAVTTMFRNWDYPERRQIFAGFRCARDASPEESNAGRDRTYGGALSG